MATPEDMRPPNGMLDGQGGVTDGANLDQRGSRVAEIINKYVIDRGFDPEKSLILCSEVIDETEREENGSEEDNPEIELRELYIKIAELEKVGHFSNHPEETATYKNMVVDLKKLRHERQCRDYCFVYINSLTEAGASAFNERLGSQDARIGVYDAAMLGELDGWEEAKLQGAELWFRATPEQIQSAKIFDVGLDGEILPGEE